MVNATCEHAPTMFWQGDCGVVTATRAPGAVDAQFVAVSTKELNRAQAVWPIVQGSPG